MPEGAEGGPAIGADGDEADPFTALRGPWLQVVPALAPPVGGVSEFARRLGIHLHSAQVLEFASALHPSRGGPIADGKALLLHYVGYGYHPRGVPLELVRLWEAARRASPGARFGVHFHEVRAFGPPWRSSFWLLPLQRSIARRLLVASDAAVTSLGRYRRMLEGLAPGHEVAVLPIPSTIGEPDSLPPWTGRAERLIVFGSAGVRERAWSGERGALATAVRQLGVREVVDLGPGAVAPAAVAGVPVSAVGELPAAQASALLAGARAGFLAYPPDYLDKSTVYGAYLAHGLLPLCAWGGPRGRSPLADEPWVRATSAGVELATSAEALARRAHEGYPMRSVARHAELWRRLLLSA